MIKVTVLYNLPAETDEAAFVRWRTGPHHAANVAQPGVLRSDFYRVVGTPRLGPDRPAADTGAYRFITESYWPNLASFHAAWDHPDEQARLVPAIARISDALFLVSEELQTYEAPAVAAPGSGAAESR